MEIREVQPSDVAPCADLFAAVFANPPWNENWTLESARQRLSECAATPGFFGMLAETSDGIGGFAVGYLQRYADERHYYLLELCVGTHRQRQGIGGALLAALETRLRAIGANRLYTLTARDTPAQAFYERSGFYTSPRMVLMARRLSA